MLEHADASMTTATGSPAASSEWLDVHFEAARPEYEQAVELVPFKPGWHILDAGCCGGSFIPLLAERTGATGKITAIDLDPDNVAATEGRLAGIEIACSVEAHVADLRALPLPDHHFDAVWLASVLMYISDEDLPTILNELKRVVRPGGLIAAKEADGEILRYLPIPMEYRRPFYEMDQAIPGMYRARFVRHRFTEAGLDQVWARTILMERWQPLRQVEREYIHGLIRGGLDIIEQVGASDEVRSWWRSQVDLDSHESVINHPEFAFIAGHVVTVGRVPE